MDKDYTINHYVLDKDIESNIVTNHKKFLTWPVVYFLNRNKKKNSKKAYVGETTDVLARLDTHAKTESKKDFSSVFLITSDLFNKSATIDIESNLIRYISADEQYELINGNLGISNHRYYQQKELYWGIFKNIWDELREVGIARHSLENIDNTDLFKYSPYKSLSKDQVQGLKMILKCILDDFSSVSLIHGGAGTGKSILAIFLFKFLKTNLEDFNFADFDEEDNELFDLLKEIKTKYGDLNMALVIPMASFRKTISKVFKNINGLSPSMVIGPADLSKQKYDLLIVDEGHRLRQRVNLGSYFSAFDETASKLGLDKYLTNELDWVLKQSNKTLIFYDKFQSIKPSDVSREDFVALEKKPGTRKELLKHQFRVRGGNDYVKFVHEIFSENTKLKNTFRSPHYEFLLFDNVDEVVGEIKSREKEYGLCRLIAGFAWKWISNPKKNKGKEYDELPYDIAIGNTYLRWNSVAIDWINSPKSIDEAGCIHTTQGYDLNYSGIIIGPELDYDFQRKCFVINKNNYKDKNGKNSIKDDEILKEYIINIYTTMFFRGIKGTYVYVCNENLRKYLSQFIPLKNAKKDKPSYKILDVPNERAIPLYDLKIAAGSFSDVQQHKNTKYIELEQPLVGRENFFACEVIGDSMNKIIKNGSICLFEKYTGGSRNGLITLVQLSNYTDSDFGSNYTIKEYRSKKYVDEDNFRHEEIILHPKSTEKYDPIVLRDDETLEFSIVGIFRKVIK